MFSQFVLGISSYITALQLIGRYKLWSYVYVSGLISLSLGGVILYLSYISSGYIGDFLVDFYPYDWGKSIIQKVAAAASGLALVTVSFFLYKYIILTVLSPLMGPLSEKLEREISGRPTDNLNVKVLVKGIWRGLRISTRNITRELFYTLILLILSLFPGAAIITTPMILIVQSYYVGFANMDYYSERHYTVKESARFVKVNQYYALGNGLVFLGMISVPIIGLFMAPSLATIAATHSILTSEKISDVS